MAQRPDVCGVMFERLTTGPVFLGLCDPLRPNAWQEPDVSEILQSLARQGFSVIIASGSGGPGHYMLANGHTEDAVTRWLNAAVMGVAL